MAAIEAGKHVYCEWPLGRNTDEAIRMRDAADRKGIRHAVGLQGQVSPAINYTKDLIAEGYIGRVLSATMIGCAPNWGPSIDRAYQADFANGANLKPGLSCCRLRLATPRRWSSSHRTRRCRTHDAHFRSHS